MPNANRLSLIGVYSILMCAVFFWAGLISAILGSAVFTVLSIIAYAVCNLLLEYCIYGKEKEYRPLRKKIRQFVLIESIQLIPYLVVIVILKLIQQSNCGSVLDPQNKFKVKIQKYNKKCAIIKKVKYWGIAKLLRLFE